VAKIIKCPICFALTEKDGVATQVFRRNGMVVTITGIPAVRVCSHCGHAVIEWETAEQVEKLVQFLLQWTENYRLPKPMVNINFPEPQIVKTTQPLQAVAV